MLVLKSLRRFLCCLWCRLDDSYVYFYAASLIPIVILIHVRQDLTRWVMLLKPMEYQQFASSNFTVKTNEISSLFLNVYRTAGFLTFMTSRDVKFASSKLHRQTLQSKPMKDHHFTSSHLHHQTLQSKPMKYQYFFWMCMVTFPMLLKPTVLQHFCKSCSYNEWFSQHVHRCLRECC